MQGFDGSLSLGGELSDQTSVFNCVILAHCAPNSDTSLIDNDNALKKQS
jgi:hypothetical protein